MRYAKAIVAIAGAIAAALEAAYPTAPWVPVVTAAAVAISVYLVPNAGKPA